MRLIFQKYKYHIISASTILFILFLILPITSSVRVEENGFYYTKSEVSLYILEYNELPPNFITKSEANSLFSNYYIAMDEGFNIGGDTYNYLGTITSLTNQTSLLECDIYFDRDLQITISKRGPARRLFSTNGA